MCATVIEVRYVDCKNWMSVVGELVLPLTVNVKCISLSYFWIKQVMDYYLIQEIQLLNKICLWIIAIY